MSLYRFVNKGRKGFQVNLYRKGQRKESKVFMIKIGSTYAETHKKASQHGRQWAKELNLPYFPLKPSSTREYAERLTREATEAAILDNILHYFRTRREFNRLVNLLLAEYDAKHLRKLFQVGHERVYHEQQKQTRGKVWRTNWSVNKDDEET